MEIFVLITDDSVKYPQENDASYAKVMSVSSVRVRVTSDGHELSAGQRAYVVADQRDLEKALQKGLVVRLDSPASGAKQSRKRTPSPKARKASADGAVRQDSESSTTQVFVPERHETSEQEKENG